MSDLPAKRTPTVTGPDKDGFMTTSGNEIAKLTPEEVEDNRIRGLHRRIADGEEITADEHADLAGYHRQRSVSEEDLAARETDDKPGNDYSALGD